MGRYPLRRRSTDVASSPSLTLSHTASEHHLRRSRHFGCCDIKLNGPATILLRSLFGIREGGARMLGCDPSARVYIRALEWLLSLQNSQLPLSSEQVESSGLRNELLSCYRRNDLFALNDVSRSGSGCAEKIPLWLKLIRRRTGWKTNTTSLRVQVSCILHHSYW